MALRIAVSGASGRMGQALARLIAGSGDLELVGGIDRERLSGEAAARIGYPRVETVDNAASVLGSADVLLDFSAPAALARLLAEQADALAGRAIVVGTTGLGDDVLRLLDAAAARSPVLVSANFSVGVNVLLALVEQAARLLPPERFDVEIVETHHRNKVDAPSGTALALGRAIAGVRGVRLEEVRRDGRSGETGKRPVGEIGFHALRGGEVVGEHRVQFLGAYERIELAHAAADRALFADGALLAARWIAGRPPGHYTMRQVLGL